MLFRIALLLLFLWFIRPQDWIGAIRGVGIVKPLMLAWIAAWFFSTRQQRSPVKGFLSTPHDWAMLSYYLYACIFSPTSSGALMGLLGPVVFYSLTVQSIVSTEQIYKYLKFWNAMLVVLAVFAVLSLYGIDLTEGASYTAEHKGRLSLGTWIHNNPNALGHSLIVALPLTYIFYFRGQNFFRKYYIFPVFTGIVLYAIWETQSKGSFLVGAMLLTALVIFNSGWIMRIFIMVLAGVLGTSALSFMPRMEQMGDLRADEGVQGRLLAWEHARSTVKAQPTGVGWKTFRALIPWKERKRTVYLSIATHSSYVQIAADLGYAGMYFFTFCLFLASKSILHRSGANQMEKDCQHGIGILLLSYILSGWMINREYHTEYFLTIAIAACYYRVVRMKPVVLAEDEASLQRPPKASRYQRKPTRYRSEEVDTAPVLSLSRRRPSLLEMSLNGLITISIFAAWDYILKTI